MNVLLDKLAEQTEHTKPELEEQIEEKMKEFSGLVSKEGALHLVANDLGVEFDDVPEELQIDQLVADMPQVDITAKVVDIQDPREFERDDGTGKVQNIVIGDETGTIRLALWDEQLDIVDDIEEGAVLHFEKAYTVEGWQDKPELRIGRQTVIERTDEEINAADEPAFSSNQQKSYDHVTIDDIRSPDQYCAVRGTILAVYGKNATYTVCETCGETATEQDGSYHCDEHGSITGKNELAVSTILDDGTGTLRCVFFRDRARQLLNIADDTEITDDTAVEHAEHALGKEVTVKGFVKENDYFERLELIVSQCDTVNPDDILTQKLEAIL